jgi:hypothetical protein
VLACKHICVCQVAMQSAPQLVLKSGGLRPDKRKIVGKNYTTLLAFIKTERMLPTDISLCVCLPPTLLLISLEQPLNLTMLSLSL